MDEFKNDIDDAFREIKAISMLLPTNPRIADKYGITFLGEKKNIIMIDELHHALDSYFHIKISNDELQQMLHTLCRIHNMKPEPDDNVSPIERITLW